MQGFLLFFWSHDQLYNGFYKTLLSSPFTLGLSRNLTSQRLQNPEMVQTPSLWLCQMNSNIKCNSFLEKILNPPLEQSHTPFYAIKFQVKLYIHCSNFKTLTLSINFDHPNLSPTHGNEVLNSFRLSKPNETSLTTPLTTFVH